MYLGRLISYLILINFREFGTFTIYLIGQKKKKVKIRIYDETHIDLIFEFKSLLNIDALKKIRRIIIEFKN